MLKKGYGFAGYKLGIDNTQRLKFLIASVTKTFTAAAIIVIERQGWRSFEDPLSKFLQDFPSGDKIKISHLLLHTLGGFDREKDGRVRQLLWNGEYPIQKVRS